MKKNEAIGMISKMKDFVCEEIGSFEFEPQIHPNKILCKDDHFCFFLRIKHSHGWEGHLFGDEMRQLRDYLDQILGDR